MTEYKVIEAINANELKHAVEKAFREGWKLQGGPHYAEYDGCHMWYQGVVR